MRSSRLFLARQPVAHRDGAALRGAVRARSRHQRQDSQGRSGQLAGDADAALPRRCLRPARDRIAEPQGGRRVGGEDDDRLGHAERPARAVGLGQSRLGQRAPRGARGLAVQGRARRRGARLDAGHQRHGEGEGLQSGRARGAAGRSGGRSERGGTRRPRTARLGPTEAELTAYLDVDQGQGQGRRGAGRQADLRAGQPHAAGRTADRRSRCAAATTRARRTIPPARRSTRGAADAAAVVAAADAAAAGGPEPADGAPDRRQGRRVPRPEQGGVPHQRRGTPARPDRRLRQPHLRRRRRPSPRS